MIRALAFIAAALACLSDLKASGVDEASAVVMGTITAGIVSDQKATASLRVDHVLKGIVAVGQVLKVEGPGYSAPENIAAAIAFTLKQTSTRYGALGDRWRLLRVMLALPKSPGVISSFERLADSPNLEIQIAALAGLLRAGRVDYLPNLLALPESLPNGLMVSAFFSALGSICDNGPTALSRLGSLLTAQHVDSRLRLAAAHSLARIHSAATLAFLDQSLANPDPNVQKLGVEGFSLFVENMPVRTPESAVTGFQPPASPFKNAVTDKYVRIYPAKDDELPELVVCWRQWYRSNQSAIEQRQ